MSLRYHPAEIVGGGLDGVPLKCPILNEPSFLAGKVPLTISMSYRAIRRRTGARIAEEWAHFKIKATEDGAKWLLYPSRPITVLSPPTK